MTTGLLIITGVLFFSNIVSIITTRSLLKTNSKLSKRVDTIYYIMETATLRLLKENSCGLSLLEVNSSIQSSLGICMVRPNKHDDPNPFLDGLTLSGYVESNTNGYSITELGSERLDLLTGLKAGKIKN